MEQARIPLLDDSVPVSSHSLDNSSGNLIVFQNDVITDSKGHRYQIVGNLGHGKFGQVYQVIEIAANSPTPLVFAMKITKSMPQYRHQANQEVGIYRLMQENATEDDLQHLSQLVNAFEFQQHVCIVMNLYSFNIYEVLTRNNYRGFPLKMVQTIMQEILQSLVFLRQCGIIHSDIKPENILLSDGFSPSVTLVDFGSARTVAQPCLYYIQSRFYRAPEVVLGIPHSYPIDIWSLGCVGAELFLGMPLFPGQNECHLLELMEKMLGPFPPKMITDSPYKDKFFAADGRVKQGIEACKEKQVGFKNYFVYENLPDLIFSYEPGKGATHEEQGKERTRRNLFVDFLLKLLVLDPNKRLSPGNALQQPFITADFTV